MRQKTPHQNSTFYHATLTHGSMLVSCVLIVCAMPIVATAESPLDTLWDNDDVILLAEGPGDLPPPPDKDLDSTEMTELRQKIFEKIRTKRDTLFAEKLELDDDTSAKLSEILDEYYKARIDIAQRRRGAMRSLRTLAEDDSSTNSDLKEATQKLEDILSKEEQLRKDMFNNADSVLDVKQQAKLYLVVPRFEKKVRKMMRKVRRKAKKHGKKRKKRKKRSVD